MKAITPLLVLAAASGSAAAKEPLFLQELNTDIRGAASDESVNWDYDIVYVRARREGDEVDKRFHTDFSQPVTMQPGADLMLLHPDGSEELLAEGGDGGITDPIMSFDGGWVYYVKIHNLVKASQWNPPAEGADICKIHLTSRRVVRLTNQQFTPNTGAGDWAGGNGSRELLLGETGIWRKRDSDDRSTDRGDCF